MILTKSAPRIDWTAYVPPLSLPFYQYAQRDAFEKTAGVSLCGDGPRGGAIETIPGLKATLEARNVPFWTYRSSSNRFKHYAINKLPGCTDKTYLGLEFSTVKKPFFFEPEVALNLPVLKRKELARFQLKF